GGVLDVSKSPSVEGMQWASAGRLAVQGPAGSRARGANTAHACKSVDAAEVAAREGVRPRAARGGPGQGAVHRVIGEAGGAAPRHGAKAHALGRRAAKAWATHEGAAAKAHALGRRAAKAWATHEGAAAKAHALGRRAAKAWATHEGAAAKAHALG